MKARKAPQLSAMPPTGAAKKPSNERNSIQYLKTQTSVLPETSSKPIHAYTIFTKTQTAFPKNTADQQDSSVRKSGRHARTGSDGIKPSKAGIRNKANEKS